MTLHQGGLRALDRATCLALLAGERVGRVGISVAALPVILPVNYVVHDGAILVRTAPGTKLSAALDRAVVAFEVDGIDRAGYGWSVLVQGPAEVVEDRETTERARLLLRSWATSEADHVIRISPANVSGRSLSPSHALGPAAGDGLVGAESGV